MKHVSCIQPDKSNTWTPSAARQMTSATLSLSSLAVSKSEASGTLSSDHGINSTASAGSFNLSSSGSDMHYYSYLLHAAHQRQQQEQQQQHVKQQEQQKQLQIKQQQKDEQERHKLMLAVLGLVCLSG